MPELPEVETTRRGIAPHLIGRRVEAVVVRQPRLRWPVPPALSQALPGQVLSDVTRRAKYLLIASPAGTLLLHLGMSGSLRLVPAGTAPRPHDHLDLQLDDRQLLRLHDPRRFGAALWLAADELAAHPLLAGLGPEPLGPDFDGDHLYTAARGRRLPVKALIMDQRVVVGVGNIYASEALHRAGIDPRRAAGRIAAARYRILADEIRGVLAAAIAQGGTTLRDFVGGDGRPGYFAQQLHVYGRAGQACQRCGGPIRSQRIAQRSSYYCPRCQR